MSRPRGSARLEELDWRVTPMGELSLRRRREPSLDVDVYEVRLGEEFLMSSLFTHAEEELARLGLAAVDGDELDVLVGGLGLGYTARAALTDPRIRSLQVVDTMAAVIAWHERGLLPHAAELTRDPRCRLVRADFFALMAGAEVDPGAPAAWHAVLLDVDHNPRHLLSPAHAPFYRRDGLAALAARLHPGGVFALWSDDPPDPDFLAVLGEVFPGARAEVVAFPNHYTGGTSSNTVYVARRPAPDQMAEPDPAP